MEAQLFPKSKRKPPRVMMALYDAGDGHGDTDGYIACFKCKKCGHKEEWVQMRTITEGKRGIPCPRCNGDKDVYI